MHNNQNSIVAGSLSAVARKSGHSLAMGFMNVKAFVMVDVSGSMMACDVEGRTRYDVACEQLARLQEQNPGEVGVASFSDRADFCPAGIPIINGGGTDMVAALGMLRMADNTGIQLVLISDGEPNDPAGTLKEAAKFTSKIDTIFVGPEGDHGAEFLRKLAAATGGVSVVNSTDQLGKLSENITKLIAA